VRKSLALALIVASAACTAFAQTNSGELRLKVTDPAGLAAQATVELSSRANEYRLRFTTDSNGTVTAKPLPFGIYEIKIQVKLLSRGLYADHEPVSMPEVEILRAALCWTWSRARLGFAGHARFVDE